MLKTIISFFKNMFRKPDALTATEPYPNEYQYILGENAIIKVRVTQLQDANLLARTEIEALRAERARMADIIKGMIRLCRVAYTIMNRKRSKKGVTREAAAEWMEEFETLTALHFKDITNIDAE